MDETNDRYYLVEVWGCIEPSIIGEAHKTYKSLLKEARVTFAGSSKYEEGENILFYLKVTDGIPTVHSFTDEELDNDEAEDEVIEDNIQKGQNPFGLPPSKPGETSL